MHRPWQIWGSFLACVWLVALGVGWLSLRAIEADRAERVTRELASIEENVRLALWRLETVVAPLLADEGVRPPTAYSIAPSSTNANAPPYPQQQIAQVTLADPFRAESDAVYVQLYFQIDCDGHTTSPQVWASQFSDDGGTGSNSNDLGFGEKLDQFRKLVKRDELEDSIPPIGSVTASDENNSSNSDVDGNDENWQENRTEHNSSNWANEPGNAAQLRQAMGRGRDGPTPQAQQSRNAAEFQKRKEITSKPRSLSNRSGPQFESFNEFTISPLRPVIHQGQLLLVRRARVGESSFLQGVWLDWATLEQRLIQEVTELLPGAQLILTADIEPSRSMASLPVLLRLPAREPTIETADSPVRHSLFLAWGALALAALAVGILLRGVIALSERRASFVSAVTHELRTPLTTFRMYSEMLADGMVTEPNQQTRYLTTLRVEADRLSHLVENVLAYARLERGGLGNRIAPTPAELLVTSTTTRAAERAAQGGMEMIVHPLPVGTTALVKADCSAVEQIVFNLVDNACKYGSTGDVRRIELTPTVENQYFQLRIADFGTGIREPVRRRLFEAFSKSADEAAVTAPGVGLGLALSRRLARDMGGELKLDAQARVGAVFLLTLTVIPERDP